MVAFNNLFSLLVLVSLTSFLAEDNYIYSANDKADVFTDTKSEYVSGNVPSISLKPEKVYESVEDEDQATESKLYFQDVFSISSMENGFLINDDAGGQIIQCDKDFKLINVIGQKGLAPGEFNQPRHSVLDKGLLYSSGTSNGGFAVYDLSGKLKSSFKSNSPDHNPILTKFTVFDSNIFHSTPNSDNLINSIDTKGNVIKSFGNKISGFSKQGKQVLDRGLIIKNNCKSFYFITENAPLIQKYSKSGHLITTHNLIDHPYFESFYKGVQERQRKSKRNDVEYLLCQDVQLYKDKLYLLMYAYDSEYNVSLQKVLEINLNEDNLVLEEEIILELHESAKDPVWCESISISDSKIVAYESISGFFLEYRLSR